MLRTLSLITLLIASGCAYVSPTTLAQLSAKSPLEADPADIAVAIRMPEGFGVVTDSAVLTVRAEYQTTGETISEEFVLKQTNGANAEVFEIAPDDLDRMRETQATVITWESTDPAASSGSVSVSSDFCKTVPDVTLDGGVSILIRTDADGAFLPLVTNAPVAEIDESGVLDTIKPC